MGIKYIEKSVVVTLLQSYGCEFVCCEYPGYEKWVTSDGYKFTISLENGCYYDDEIIKGVIVHTLERELPENWLNLIYS